MDYLALAGGVIFGLTALRSVLIIIVASLGKGRYAYASGFLIEAIIAGASSALAAWLFAGVPG